MRALLAGGARVDARGDLGSWTPLHVAAGQGHAAVVEALIAAGANPFVYDDDRRLALHWAESSGHRSAALALRWRAAGIEPASRPLIRVRPGVRPQAASLSEAQRLDVLAVAAEEQPAFGAGAPAEVCKHKRQVTSQEELLEAQVRQGAEELTTWCSAAEAAEERAASAEAKAAELGRRLSQEAQDCTEPRSKGDGVVAAKILELTTSQTLQHAELTELEHALADSAAELASQRYATEAAEVRAASANAEIGELTARHASQRGEITSLEQTYDAQQRESTEELAALRALAEAAEGHTSAAKLQAEDVRSECEGVVAGKVGELTARHESQRAELAALEQALAAQRRDSSEELVAIRAAAETDKERAFAAEAEAERLQIECESLRAKADEEAERARKAETRAAAASRAFGR